jgi:hypothetical protein
VKGSLEKLQSEIAEFAANGKNGVEVQVLVDQAKVKLNELKVFAEQNNKFKLEVGVDGALRSVDRAAIAIKTLNTIQTNSKHDVKEDVATVAARIKGLNGMNTTSTHTIYTQTVERRAAGGMVGTTFNRVRNLVRGPGTATSDSVNAKLSRGEYVVKASSVEKFGIGFMNAINAGIFPLKGVIPNTPAATFSGGTQRLASGGVVGGTDEMLIKLDIGGKQYPVRSSRDTAKGLSDALRQISRGR